MKFFWQTVRMILPQLGNITAINECIISISKPHLNSSRCELLTQAHHCCSCLVPLQCYSLALMFLPPMMVRGKRGVPVSQMEWFTFCTMSNTTHLVLPHPIFAAFVRRDVSSSFWEVRYGRGPGFLPCFTLPQLRPVFQAGLQDQVLSSCTVHSHFPILLTMDGSLHNLCFLSCLPSVRWWLSNICLHFSLLPADSSCFRSLSIRQFDSLTVSWTHGELSQTAMFLWDSLSFQKWINSR